MAYTGIDKEIYDSGVHFRPLQEYTQQQWTPPAIMGQNTNAGIVNTQAAGSYMGYPSYEAWLLAQGGGGGGGGNDPVDNINRGGVNQNLGPTNITDYESEAYGVGPTFKGTIARLQDAYSKLPTPGNLLMKGIRHWKGKRDTRIAEEKVAADKAASQLNTQGPAGEPTYGGPVTYDYDPKQDTGQRPDKPGGFTDPGKGSYGPHKAEGGRIGYNRGRVVNPGGYSGMSMFQAWLQDQYGIGMGDIKTWDHYAGLSREWNRLGGSKAQGGLIGYFDGGIARLL